MQGRGNIAHSVLGKRCFLVERKTFADVGKRALLRVHVVSIDSAFSERMATVPTASDVKMPWYPLPAAVNVSELSATLHLLNRWW